MTWTTLALLLIALALAWVAYETRRVWQALDRYAQEIRSWHTMLNGFVEQSPRPEDLG